MPIRPTIILAALLACSMQAWGAVDSAGDDTGQEEIISPADFNERQALDYSQAAVGRQLGDYSFSSIESTSTRLSLPDSGPMIISLIYTSCYHTCPMITRSLIAAVETANETFGADAFSVVTIGFDVKEDTPARMRSFAAGHAIDFPNWRVLSADQATIEALSKDLGFIYFASPKGFDHLAQTTVIDAEGRVFRQVYGANFLPPNVMEPLKSLIFDVDTAPLSLTGLTNRVRLFCTIYDPKSGRYRFDYSLFVTLVIGALCLTGVAVILVREWHRSSRHGTE